MIGFDDASLRERVTYWPYGLAEHRWPGDIDGDDNVDGDDFTAVYTAINLSPSPVIGDAEYDADMDLNRDGVIDIFDLLALGNWYGRVPVGPGRISDPEGIDNVAGYCGFVFNAENALYTVRFRWYDPVTGRWLQRDPAGYVDGVNLYEMLGSSPLVYLDPFGLNRVCGIRVWLLTGSWCEDRAIYDYADDAFSQTVWDRTNGTLDAVTFNTVDLEDLAGIDWTFDQSQRANAECVADCIADTLANTVVPIGMPPGCEINLFRSGPILSCDPRKAADPREWMPSAFRFTSYWIERAYRGYYYKWKVKPGRTELGPSLRGDNRQRTADRIGKAGKALEMIKFTYDVLIGCQQECAKTCPVGP